MNLIDLQKQREEIFIKSLNSGLYNYKLKGYDLAIGSIKEIISKKIFNHLEYLKKFNLPKDEINFTNGQIDALEELNQSLNSPKTSILPESNIGSFRKIKRRIKIRWW